LSQEGKESTTTKSD